MLSTEAFSSQSDANSQLWLDANDAYSLGEYQEAVDIYKEIEASGSVSYKLYYNMANSYYKLQNDGMAILYYERALKLNPANEDIKTNLEIARLKTLDKIENVPEFILSSWVKGIRNSFSSDNWAVAAIILFAVFAFLMLSYKYGFSLTVRKVSFSIGVCVLFFSIVAALFAFSLRSRAISQDNAVILQPVSDVKSAPNSTGSNLFILHEGTKVEVIESVGEWSRIELADGRQGWIETSDFEII